jgi:hypothetical protein
VTPRPPGRAGFVRRNVEEIVADPVLRVYGSAVAAVHVLTFLHWWRTSSLHAFLTVDAVPVCWPFFGECHRVRFLGVLGVDALLWGYLALGLTAGALFWRRTSVGPAWGVLLALEGIKLLVILQDYRLRLNQHYMALFVALVFLLLPGKRRLLQYLIVAFYFWAGTIKLDPDWLAGLSLARRGALWIPVALVPAACVYVVVLELVLVFGVLSRRAWLFWGTLGQLALFHVMSWPIVGFYYPTLMFALLSVFPLSRLAGSPADWPGLARLAAGREPRSSYALLAGFSLLQLVPYAYPGDSAVTGEGRFLALHMFDARVVCEAYVTLHDADGGTRRVKLTGLGGPARTRCDPIVFFSVARTLCREGTAEGRWVDLDLSLRARRISEPALRPVIAVDGFCRRDLRYDVWRPNAWIMR